MARWFSILVMFMFLAGLLGSIVFGYGVSIDTGVSIGDSERVWELVSILDSRSDRELMDMNKVIKFIMDYMNWSFSEAMDWYTNVYWAYYRLEVVNGSLVYSVRFDIYNSNDYDLVNTSVWFYIDYSGLDGFNDSIDSGWYIVVADNCYPPRNVSEVVPVLVERVNTTHAIVYVRPSVLPAGEWRSFYLVWDRVTVVHYVNRLVYWGIVDVEIGNEEQVREWLERQHDIEKPLVKPIKAEGMVFKPTKEYSFVYGVSDGNFAVWDPGKSVYRSFIAGVFFNVTVPMVVNVTNVYFLGESGIAIVDKDGFWSAVGDNGFMENNTVEPLLLDMARKYRWTAFIMYWSLPVATSKVQKVKPWEITVSNCIVNGVSDVCASGYPRAYVLLNGEIVEEKEFKTTVGSGGYGYKDYGDMSTVGLPFAGDILFVFTDTKIYVVSVVRNYPIIDVMNNKVYVYEKLVQVLFVLDNVWGDEFVFMLFGESNYAQGVYSGVSYEWLSYSRYLGKPLKIRIHYRDRVVEQTLLSIEGVLISEEIVDEEDFVEKAIEQVFVNKTSLPDKGLLQVLAEKEEHVPYNILLTKLRGEWLVLSSVSSASEVGGKTSATTYSGGESVFETVSKRNYVDEIVSEVKTLFSDPLARLVAVVVLLIVVGVAVIVLVGRREVHSIEEKRIEEAKDLLKVFKEEE